jgi:glucosamine--fructose-6-phosphate aminotransferase (isomerizing)
MNSPVVDPAVTRMYREASQAPAAVRAQLQRNRETLARLGMRLRESPPRAVVTCARGSSDHAATYAKYLIETRIGVLTASAAPSIASVYRASQDLGDCLFIAISQSGRSPDLLDTTRAAKKAGARVVALINDERSPLADIAECVVPLCAGEERSVAATKSYVASLSALAHLVAEWARDVPLASALQRAPEDLARAWSLDWSQVVAKLRAAGNLYVIARGVGLAVAQEAALKCKETCGLHAESFSSAEVRHGPQALLRGGFPALVFVQHDETREGTEQLARELAQRGVDVMVAGAAIEGATVLPTVGTHPALEPMMVIESFYRAANALALARGRDPDRPPHLAKVTRTT